jgi:hypothetical protein
MPLAFVTPKGFRLRRIRVGGDDVWADDADIEKADMACYAGPDGLPVDALGTPLEGALELTPDEKRLPSS